MIQMNQYFRQHPKAEALILASLLALGAGQFALPTKSLSRPADLPEQLPTTGGAWGTDALLSLRISIPSAVRPT
jgi:hypothetical protein